MSHEKGDGYVSNSYMDMDNNLLGNEAGVTHRAEIIACLNLMVNFATQKVQQENRSSIFETIDQLDVFGYSSTLGPYTDLSPQTIARRFSIQNPQTNNIKDPEACNKLKKIIKDVYMPRLYYKETSSCDSAMGGTPNTTNWELDRKPFDEYRTNMEAAIAQ